MRSRIVTGRGRIRKGKVGLSEVGFEGLVGGRVGNRQKTE